MTDHQSKQRYRIPKKVVKDEERAKEILAELRDLENTLRVAAERRLELVLEAADVGLTTRKIAAAAETSPMAISRWIRSAQETLE